MEPELEAHSGSGAGLTEITGDYRNINTHGARRHPDSRGHAGVSRAAAVHAGAGWLSESPLSPLIPAAEPPRAH